MSDAVASPDSDSGPDAAVDDFGDPLPRRRRRKAEPDEVSPRAPRTPARMAVTALIIVVSGYFTYSFVESTAPSHTSSPVTSASPVSNTEPVAETSTSAAPASGSAAANVNGFAARPSAYLPPGPDGTPLSAGGSAAAARTAALFAATGLDRNAYAVATGQLPDASIIIAARHADGAVPAGTAISAAGPGATTTTVHGVPAAVGSDGAGTAVAAALARPDMVVAAYAANPQAAVAALTAALTAGSR